MNIHDYGAPQALPPSGGELKKEKLPAKEAAEQNPPLQMNQEKKPITRTDENSNLPQTLEEKAIQSESTKSVASNILSNSANLVKGATATDQTPKKSAMKKLSTTEQNLVMELKQKALEKLEIIDKSDVIEKKTPTVFYKEKTDEIKLEEKQPSPRRITFPENIPIKGETASPQRVVPLKPVRNVQQVVTQSSSETIKSNIKPDPKVQKILDNDKSRNSVRELKKSNPQLYDQIILKANELAKEGKLVGVYDFPNLKSFIESLNS